MYTLSENANLSGHLPNDVLLAIIEILPKHIAWRLLTTTGRRTGEDNLFAALKNRLERTMNFTYGTSYSLWQYQNAFFGAGWRNGAVFGESLHASNQKSFQALNLPNILSHSPITQFLSSGKTTVLFNQVRTVFLTGLVRSHTYKHSAVARIEAFTVAQNEQELDGFQAERLFPWPDNVLVQLASVPWEHEKASIAYGTAVLVKTPEQNAAQLSIKKYALPLDAQELVAHTAWTEDYIFILTNTGRIIGLFRELGMNIAYFNTVTERFRSLCCGSSRLYALSQHGQVFIFDPALMPSHAKNESQNFAMVHWPVAGLNPNETLTHIAAYDDQLVMLSSKHRLLASAPLAEDRTFGLFGRDRRAFTERRALLFTLPGLDDTGEHIEALRIEHSHAVVSVKNRNTNTLTYSIFGKNSRNEQGFASPPSEIDTIKPAEIYNHLEENHLVRKL